MNANRSEQKRPRKDRTWVDQEFGGVDLGDTRRDARLVELARDLAKRPQVSLPQALQDSGALKAAYRFFDNKDVSARDMLAPHLVSSVQRMRGQPLVLAVQDTTFIDYAGHRATEGLGPTSDKGGWGMLCHATLAFTPEGLPLGVLGLRIWARDPKKTGIKVTRRKRAIEDIVVLRIEQLYPFPHEEFRAQIAMYPNAKSVVWAQEEPGNQGAWHRIQHYLQREMRPDQTLSYALRPSSASPAVGYLSKHLEQQKELVNAALSWDVATSTSAANH